jgi:hypothetical protein
MLPLARSPELYLNAARTLRKRKRFYDDEGHIECKGEKDVVPEYFKECERLVTTFSDSIELDNQLLAIKPLFPGSVYSAKDLARSFLSFKAKAFESGG